MVSPFFVAGCLALAGSAVEWMAACDTPCHYASGLAQNFGSSPPRARHLSGYIRGTALAMSLLMGRSVVSLWAVFPIVGLAIGACGGSALETEQGRAVAPPAERRTSGASCCQGCGAEPVALNASKLPELSQLVCGSEPTACPLCLPSFEGYSTDCLSVRCSLVATP